VEYSKEYKKTQVDDKKQERKLHRKEDRIRTTEKRNGQTKAEKHCTLLKV
jgi:hypothetical protein